MHQGIRITLEALKDNNFYWPNMIKDGQKFLSQCVCAKKKLDKFKQISMDNDSLLQEYWKYVALIFTNITQNIFSL